MVLVKEWCLAECQSQDAPRYSSLWAGIFHNSQISSGRFGDECKGFQKVANFNNFMKVNVKLSLCLTKHHAMKTYGPVDI
jgi:hypothetical protein